MLYCAVQHKIAPILDGAIFRKVSDGISFVCQYKDDLLYLKNDFIYHLFFLDVDQSLKGAWLPHISLKFREIYPNHFIVILLLLINYCYSTVFTLRKDTYAMTITKTGKLPFRLMNDYLFRAVFQSHPRHWRGFAVRCFISCRRIRLK